jgi:heat shock protein HtpX
MVLTLVCVLVLYVAVVAATIWAAVALRWWSPVIVIPVGVVVAVTVIHYRSATALALRAVAGQVVDEAAEPELHRMVGRLAALADLPAPRVAIVESVHPNAFTVGVRSGASTVAVTTGLRDALSRAEVEAVVAHELAHIANRDASVMTVASIPRTLGEEVIGEEGVVFYLWWPLWWVGLPIWALGSLLTLMLSRYREFTADRGSALLTGRPADLMSALQKVAGADERIPDADLRQLAAVDALCVVSRGTTRIAFFSDHPPLHNRLQRLAELSRELGTPTR